MAAIDPLRMLLIYLLLLRSIRATWNDAFNIGAHPRRARV
jgi:hypothetical protein